MFIWRDKKLQEEFDFQRDIKDSKHGRLTYNCFNTGLFGTRVRCTKGRKLSNAADNGMNIGAVLRGTTASICIKCPFYEEEDNV